MVIFKNKITYYYMKVLLCTIAIGEEYLNTYNILFRKSQEDYAKKYGYDFKVFTDYLSDLRHPHTISFNKILVCGYMYPYYDLVIFIDADVLINGYAPPIHEKDFQGKIGVVDEFSQPTKKLRLHLQRQENYPDKTAIEFYKLCGFDIETELVFNTGLLVMNPVLHKDFLEKIYNKYVLNSLTHPRGFIYEETCISYELIKNGMYYVLDNKWNTLYALYKMTNYKPLQNVYNSNYFIHFAGKVDFDKIPTINYD